MIYAGQRHEQRLPDGARGGFFVGDGTGLGKGRVLAGIIADNWNQNRQRALWFSVNNDLLESTRRDLHEVLILPVEEHELPDTRETPFITTLSYAQKRIGDIEQAREFHSLAHVIAGETTDARMQITVFKHYYDRIPRDHASRNREAERAKALSRTIEEMRLLAAEMARLETRESVAVPEHESTDIAIEMNVSARKISG